MIAMVSGRLAAKNPGGTIIMDTGPVGYRLFVSLNTLVDLPEVGEKISLHTVTVVREDSFHLYGFATTRERDLFNLLVQVKGVGPRMAMQLLGGLKPDDLEHAIASQDPGWISTIPGVGKKTAERIILELRDKVGPIATDNLSRAAGADDQMVSDVVSALSNLGYRRSEGQKAVAQVLKSLGEPKDFQALVRESLKLLSGRKG